MKKWLEKSLSTNLYQVALHLIILTLAVEVFVLARQNRELKSYAGIPGRGVIKPGDFLSISELIPINGSHAVDSSLSQLVYVFSTTCPFCKNNIASWKEIERSASAKWVSVVGICLDVPEKATKYVMENQLSFSVYVPKDNVKYRESNRIGSVPMTILRSPGGEVQRIWTGRLSNDQIIEIGVAISKNQNPQITQRRQ